jgi:hypothetical protein
MSLAEQTNNFEELARNLKPKRDNVSSPIRTDVML